MGVTKTQQLDRQIAAMRLAHRRFSFTELPDGSGRWEGPLHPIEEMTDTVFSLLDDIHHERDIFVQGSRLRHFDGCTVDHCRHEWMDRVRDLTTEFIVRVDYAGGARHPACWVMEPPLGIGPHMWQDGSMCPFLASEDVWNARRNTIADFLDHAAIWLVKRMVFDRTGVWIGGEHAHTRAYYLMTLRPSDQCWCRSGKPYSYCHRREDIGLAAVGQ